MIKTIYIIIIVGIVLGIFMALPISKFLIKRYKKKVTEGAIEKISKQKELGFKTLQGKPIALKFKNDGKEIDLNKQIKDGLDHRNKEEMKRKIKEIREYKDKVKEIKKDKVDQIKKPKKKIAFIGKSPGKRKEVKKIIKRGKKK